MPWSRMVETMNTYTIEYKRDETGWWVAKVKEVKGCHTQGKSIAQARRRIREALGLFVNNANRADFVEDVILPPGVRTLVKQVLSAREKVKHEEEKVQSSMQEAARVLTGEVGISRRDAGEVLGLSYQRVQQILPRATAEKRKKQSGTVRAANNK